MAKDVDRSNRATVIFLHVPKAAGQTLFQILDHEYGRSNIFTFQGGRQHLKASMHKFENLPNVERNKYHLLRGHVKFGIHRSIKPPFTYITILRDPISRIVSHYNYVLRTPAHALHHQIISSGISLEDYVSSGISTELNNGQVRLISGVGSDLPFGQCCDEILAKAITNLEAHFSFVGLTERFDETILLMGQSLHWKKPPYYTKKNVSSYMKAGVRLTPQTIEAICKHNELDIKLYNHVAEQFEQDVKKLPNGKQLRFQLFNSAYYPYGRAVSMVAGWLRILYKKYYQ